jgi:hypothetical protein
VKFDVNLDVICEYVNLDVINDAIHVKRRVIRHVKLLVIVVLAVPLDAVIMSAVVMTHVIDVIYANPKDVNKCLNQSRLFVLVLLSAHNPV